MLAPPLCCCHYILYRLRIKGTMRSFIEKRHQMEDFIPFPSHTHPFFIPIPNRPSHLYSYHPLYVYSASPISSTRRLTPSLRLQFTFPSLLIIPTSFLALPLPVSFDFLCPLVLHSLLLFILPSTLVLSGGLWQ